MALPVGRRRTLIAVLVLWAVLAAAFGAWDLPISRWAADPSSGWGRLVDRWGAFPGLLVTLWALLLLASGALRGGGARDGAAGGLYTLLAMTALGYGGAVSAVNLGIPAADVASKGWLIWLTAGAAAVVMVILLVREGRPPTGRVRRAARAAFRLAVLDWLLFVQPAKLLWGRVRFYHLVPPDYTGFTPWYLPQGCTGHFSFPSGHTAMGWMLLPLLLLVSSRRPATRAAVGTAIIGWGLFVALGRVRYGAHFPSDVLFPTALAAVIMLSERPEDAPLRS
ncbi:MAG: phosphatase PAP2 family protein [bacterium]